MRSSCSGRLRSIRCLSTPSMPGVLAPRDASVIRAASCSHDRSAITLRRRSNRRSRSSEDHLASLLCISLIIKGLHLMVSAILPNKPLKLFPFAVWQALPASDYYGNSASPPSIGVAFP